MIGWFSKYLFRRREEPAPVQSVHPAIERFEATLSEVVERVERNRLERLERERKTTGAGDFRSEFESSRRRVREALKKATIRIKIGDSRYESFVKRGRSNDEIAKKFNIKFPGGYDALNSRIVESRLRIYQPEEK